MLSITELRTALPAIPESSHSASKRFRHMSSIDVAEELYERGWEARSVAGVIPRDPSQRAFAKHLVRFAHPHGEGFSQTPGASLEVVLINAHDGTTALQLAVGFLRFVCMNGMIVGDMMGALRMVHRGELPRPAQLVTRALSTADKHIADVRELRTATPSWAARKEFATAVAKTAWADLPDYGPACVGLLRPRREEDLAGDAWTVLNTVQENLMKGGFVLEERQGKRDKHAQSIKGVTREWELNRSAWTTAQEILV